MALEAGMSVLRRRQHAVEVLGGQGLGGQVQVPADGLGDLAGGYSLVSDSVEH